MRYPAARSPRSTIAVTDPLPFVPAIDEPRIGAVRMTERREQRANLFEAELDPDVFEREQIGAGRHRTRSGLSAPASAAATARSRLRR